MPTTKGIADHPFNGMNWSTAGESIRQIPNEPNCLNSCFGAIPGCFPTDRLSQLFHPVERCRAPHVREDKYGKQKLLKEFQIFPLSYGAQQLTTGDNVPKNN